MGKGGVTIELAVITQEATRDGAIDNARMKRGRLQQCMHMHTDSRTCPAASSLMRACTGKHAQTIALSPLPTFTPMCTPKHIHVRMLARALIRIAEHAYSAAHTRVAVHAVETGDKTSSFAVLNKRVRASLHLERACISLRSSCMLILCFLIRPCFYALWCMLDLVLIVHAFYSYASCFPTRAGERREDGAVGGAAPLLRFLVRESSHSLLPCEDRKISVPSKCASQ
eukprot:6178619-Pleurochrysis_carterae.AAC.3